MDARIQSVSEYICVSYAMATACRVLANREADEQLRDDLLTTEQRWLFLAQSLECMESLGRFLVGAAQEGTAATPSTLRGADLTGQALRE
jgi:hypothetical protein